MARKIKAKKYCTWRYIIIAHCILQKHLGKLSWVRYFIIAQITSNILYQLIFNITSIYLVTLLRYKIKPIIFLLSFAMELKTYYWPLLRQWLFKKVWINAQAIQFLRPQVKFLPTLPTTIFRSGFLGLVARHRIISPIQRHIWYQNSTSGMNLVDV